MTTPAERQWSSGMLSLTASYRLLVCGDVGPREIESLVRLLEVQKSVLEGSMAECASAEPLTLKD